MVRKLIFPTLICLSFFSYSQNGLDLPYKGGSNQFDKDVAKNLYVESLDSGRIYFVEIIYSTTKKEAEAIIHGAREKDITTRLIDGFFQKIKNNWDKKFLRSSNIVIPLFISPYVIDNPSSEGRVNMDQFAKVIADSFKSKKCFLYKPVYTFNQGAHIDMEPQ